VKSIPSYLLSRKSQRQCALPLPSLSPLPVPSPLSFCVCNVLPTKNNQKKLNKKPQPIKKPKNLKTKNYEKTKKTPPNKKYEKTKKTHQKI
jgi:hypothetical protein